MSGSFAADEGAPRLRRAAAHARWANAVLSTACVIAVAFLLSQIVLFGYGRDQGIYAVVARTVLDGGMPYRDAWDFKPPGIFVIYTLARAIFGAGQSGVRVLEIVGLAAMVFGMARLTARLWNEPRIGLLGGALAVLVHAQLDFWHSAQPESFGGMLTIAALLCVLVPEAERGRRRPLAWVLAGALFGAAGLLKPPLAGGAVVVAVPLALDAWRASSARAMKSRALAALLPIGSLAAGGVLPFIACAVWFVQKGAAGDLYRTLFVFTPYYTAIGWEGASFLGMVYWGFTEWLTTYNSVVTLGLLALVVLRPSSHEARGVATLAGVVAMHLVGVVMQAKFFPYHFGATWPVTALLAALGLWKVWEAALARGPVAIATFFVAVVAATFGRSATKDVADSFLARCRRRVTMITSPGSSDAERDALASVADVNAAANRAVAELLRARVPADRSVFVWGFEPVIYDQSERRAATRYIYDVPQRVSWAKDYARAVLMCDLAGDPPAAIVVEHRDVFPMVTGNFLDSADSLDDFPALRGMIRDRYELTATIEDFDVYLAVAGITADAP